MDALVKAEAEDTASSKKRNVPRDREKGQHVEKYFVDNPKYNETMFQARLYIMRKNQYEHCIPIVFSNPTKLIKENPSNSATGGTTSGVLITGFEMTNAYITSIRSIRHKPPPIHFPGRKNFQVDSFRLLHNPALASLVNNSLPLTLTSQLSPSDAPAPAQRSEEWFALRRDKLTTSAFSTALGFWKGKRRYELWHEKVFVSDMESMIIPGAIRAMEWGVDNESKAIENYKKIMGREVSSLGFATHSESKLDWVGASPDGLLGCFPNLGILEVKCPFNKGKPELALPWTNMPFYYMPQVQGQMEVLNRDWVDLYCWTLNGSTIFHVCRDREYWTLIHGILREFWWENVVPAREALAMGNEEEAKKYEPTSTHKQTGLAIRKSIELANGSKLLCREIAGHIEFFW